MRKHYALMLPALLMAASACVKPKIYRAELALRQQTEAREQVLLKELGERKTEVAKLTEQNGALNRNLGDQDAQLRNLNKELSARTQQLGASTEKLLNEKAAVESELASKNVQLAQCKDLRSRIAEVQQKRKSILEDLQKTLQKAYAAQPDISFSIANDAVVLTLPDKGLFDAGGINVAPTGKTMLTPLAAFLIERPSLDVYIVSHTDNVLPKGNKTLQDTWDWSLARAAALSRTLLREFNVNANQLQPVGRGEFKPLTSNETPEGRQRNRRTEIQIRPLLPAVPAAAVDP
ncbi:MAG: OmpA family protein [Chitinophagales bacterium]|nr:OmpA family protein [Chitinophagales bacterium]